MPSAMSEPNPNATGPITKARRSIARKLTTQPMPVTDKEREAFAQQSRKALKMAAAAGITSIKQHTNPAAVPC